VWKILPITKNKDIDREDSETFIVHFSQEYSEALKIYCNAESCIPEQFIKDAVIAELIERYIILSNEEYVDINNTLAKSRDTFRGFLNHMKKGISSNK
jgi:hypothetical protein